MKTKLAVLAIGMFMTATFGLKANQTATSITIPAGSFENLAGSVKVPALLSTTNANFGPWAVQLQGLLNLNGTMAVGPAATLGGPTPPNGTYELAVNLPVGLGTTASLTQVLTNCWQPDSTYTLSVALDQGTVANLLAGSSLALTANGTNMAVLSGDALASLLNGTSNFKTVTLTCQTGNNVPTNGIGISLVMPSVVSLGGVIYVDNFTLSVVPDQVQLSSSVVTSGPNNGNLMLSGNGGTPGEKYEILTTTNLLTPSGNWTCIMTNTLDSSGNFTQMIPVNRSTPYRFYRTFLP